MGRGRPPRALTEHRLAIILDLVAEGMPPQTAAIAAGVPERTWQTWLANGRELGAHEPYASVARRVDAAVALYQHSRIRLVAVGAEKDPRLAQWELERRFPDVYAQKIKSEVTVQARPFVDLSKMTLEQQAALVELLRIGAPDEELPADAKPALELLAASEAAA